MGGFQVKPPGDPSLLGALLIVNNLLPIDLFLRIFALSRIPDIRWAAIRRYRLLPAPLCPPPEHRLLSLEIRDCVIELCARVIDACNAIHHLDEPVALVALLLLLDLHCDDSSHLDRCLPPVRLSLFWPRLGMGCLVCKSTGRLAFTFLVCNCIGARHLRRPQFLVFDQIVVLSLLSWTPIMVCLLDLAIDFHDGVLSIFHHPSPPLFLFWFGLTRSLRLLGQCFKWCFTCQGVFMNLRCFWLSTLLSWLSHRAWRSIMKLFVIALCSVEWLLSVHSALGTKSVLLAKAFNRSKLWCGKTTLCTHEFIVITVAVWVVKIELSHRIHRG